MRRDLFSPAPTCFAMDSDQLDGCLTVTRSRSKRVFQACSWLGMHVCDQPSGSLQRWERER